MAVCSSNYDLIIFWLPSSPKAELPISKIRGKNSVFLILVIKASLVFIVACDLSVFYKVIFVSFLSVHYGHLFGGESIINAK